MESNGDENTDVQSVQQWKVLDESSGTELVTLKEGVEHLVADAWRFVRGAAQGGGVDGGLGGVGEQEWGVERGGRYGLF